SGSSYNAAQDYWAKEFSNGRIPTMTAESVPGESTTAEHGWTSTPCIVERCVLDDLRSAFQTGFSTILLAAYTVLISRLKEQEETVIVSAHSKEGSMRVVPLRFSVPGDLSLSDLIKNIERKIQQAVIHRLYAFH